MEYDGLFLLIACILIVACCQTFPAKQKRTLSYPYILPDENRGRNFIEGDILDTKQQKQNRKEKEQYDKFRSSHRRSPRNARSTTYKTNILPKKRRSSDFRFYKTWYNRTIPYMFDTSFHSKPEQTKQVEAAMATIENVSCVKFIKRESEKDFISINSLDGSCTSSVGRMGGNQSVGLGDECFVAFGVILHELLHVLGLWHEHSRQDRDNYVRVHMENIAKEHHDNFNIHPPTDTDELFQSIPYDYSSVMHYANTTFANSYALKYGLYTLTATQDLPHGVFMGQREGLSRLDEVKINALYRCDIKNCSTPSMPVNGNVTVDSVLVGATVSYLCDAGFILVGPPSRVCRDDGYWSGDPPICIELNTTSLFYYCTMENETNRFCGWRQDKSDDLEWRNYSENTLSDDTGPMWDHTYRTVYGTYLYVESSHTQPGQKARLVSPTFDLGPIKPCFVFYTHMYGQDMGNLSIYITSKSGSYTVNSKFYTLIGDQGLEWEQIFLELDEISGPFVITLEATIGNSYLSDIAIDDLMVADCSLLTPLIQSDRITEGLQCSFDDGLCDFQQSTRDDFDWTLHHGQTRSYNTGPDCDPLDCEHGTYLYIESSSPRLPGDKARLQTANIGGSGLRCLSFYYHMYGDAVGTLEVKQRSILATNETLLWTASGNQGNEWNVQHIEFNALAAYRIFFDATVGTNYRGDIAIDNVNITLGGCSGLYTFDCSFEHDLCGWNNKPIPGAAFPLNWTRHSGETDTHGTGPSSDRRKHDGFYLYVESSRTLPGDAALLVSPLLFGTDSAYCVKFSYHLNGATSGNLTLSAQPIAPPGNTGTRLWAVIGDQVDDWETKSVSVPNNLTTHPFNIVIRADMAGSLGDVAIDDISIRHSMCAS